MSEPVGIELPKGEIAIVDREDVDLVLQFRWSALHTRDGRIYVYRSVAIPQRWRQSGFKHTCISLHRFLLDPPSDLWVDHINGDGLDNRRQNLRLATPRQNAANQRKAIRPGSKYKGIHRSLHKGWVAGITCAGKDVYLGSFRNEEDAARAYDDAARAMFGEFACVNFPRAGERGCVRGHVDDGGSELPQDQHEQIASGAAR